MPTSTIDWNVKENQSCWSCNHWQRYDESPTPNRAEGECRKMPQKMQVQGTASFFAEFYTFIDNGKIFWCSEWKKSVLEVPPPPETPLPIVWPDVWEEWKPWNVKTPINQSCWSCNHWQREVVDPGPGDDKGECRKFTAPQVLMFSLAIPLFDIDEGRKILTIGPLQWCGCWEKNEGEVPPIPENQQVETRSKALKRAGIDIKKLTAAMK